jgi:hypothetical protein
MAGEASRQQLGAVGEAKATPALSAIRPQRRRRRRARAVTTPYGSPTKGRRLQVGMMQLTSGSDLIGTARSLLLILIGPILRMNRRRFCPRRHLLGAAAYRVVLSTAGDNSATEGGRT